MMAAPGPRIARRCSVTPPASCRRAVAPREFRAQLYRSVVRIVTRLDPGGAENADRRASIAQEFESFHELGHDSKDAPGFFSNAGLRDLFGAHGGAPLRGVCTTLDLALERHGTLQPCALLGEPRIVTIRRDHRNEVGSNLLVPCGGNIRGIVRKTRRSVGLKRGSGAVSIG